MKRRSVDGYSKLRAEKRREYATRMAKLTAAERLRVGLEWSEFCLKLAAAGREARSHRSSGRAEMGQ